MVISLESFKQRTLRHKAGSHATGIVRCLSCPSECDREAVPMTGEPAPGRGGSGTLRWNIVLCAGICLLALAFIAGVLFLSGSPVSPPSGSSTTAAAGKTLPELKTRILPRLGATESPAPVSQSKELPRAPAGINPLQSAGEMHPTEANMTVIAKTSGNLAYNTSTVEVDVTEAPLRIDLTVIPKTVIETKWFENKTLQTRREWIEQVPVVWPSSFANLSVIEKETGRIVARAGFGKDDSMDPTREIRVYKPGKYLVQLFGNDVAVRTVMSVRTPGLTF
jgi:hypothetical protein